MTPDTIAHAPLAQDRRMVRVWDPLIRVFHWSVVVAFFVAYFTEDDLLSLHVWAGYALGGLLVLRVLWGLFGPRHARFSDFMYAPATILSYTRDLAAFRAKRYLGHSPAGGAMIVALMLGLAATVWTGMEFYADAEGKGLLAGTASAVAAVQGPRILLVSEEKREDGADRERERESAWEDLHEVLANLTLVLVLLHIGGVVLASVAHRENLARAMVTGLKRAEE